MNNTLHPRATQTALATLAALILAATFSPSLPAADLTFDVDEGAPPIINPGDTVSIKTSGDSVYYAGAYFDPATRQWATKNFTTGPLVTTYMPFAIGNSYGATLKPIGDGTVWAQLNGDRNHQLITITEPQTASERVTIDKIAMTNGSAARGGALRVVDMGAPGKGLVIDGDILFVNNEATERGGALQTGRGSTEFTGDLLFMGNRATNTSDKNGGGAVSFGAMTMDNYKLIFSGETIFIDNQTGGPGGAIWGADDNGVVKTLEFRGTAIFDGNRAGAGATASRHGGAIGGGTEGGNARFNITFLNDVSFTRNWATGKGGAIFNSVGDIVFGGPGEFEGQQIYFSRNIATVGTSAARHGGGAITAGTNGSSNSAVYFLNPHSHVLFEQNVAAQIQSDGSTRGSDNSGIGGAIVANGGIYLLSGTFEFIGNQGSGRGGALYVHSGALPTGRAYEQYGIKYADTTPNSPYKYKIQINGNALFKDNYAFITGGAIGTHNETSGVTALGIYIGGNTQFINNKSSSDGGAIQFRNDNSFLTLDATIGDITFTGNRSGVSQSNHITFNDVETILANTTGNDGFMNTSTLTGGNQNDIHFRGAGTIEVITPAGRTIYMDGGIRGSSNATPAGVTVTKTGPGAWVFGTNANTNIPTNTQIQAGLFKLDNAQYGNTGGRTTIYSSATLAGYGYLNEAVTIQQNATIIVGELNDPYARTLNFANNLTLTTNTIKYDFFSTPEGAPAANSDCIAVTNILSANGITTLDVTSLANGSYTAIQAGSIQGASNNFRLLVNGAAPTIRNQGSSINVTANAVLITATMLSLPTTWNGVPGATWRDGASPDWLTPADPNEKYFRNTDSVTFTDAGAGTIAIGPGGVVVASMTVDSAADYTFTGTTGITTTSTITGAHVTPTEKLVKKGTGTLTFENTVPNNFAGGIDLEAGTLAINDAAQIATATTAAITFTGDATLKLNTPDIILASSIATTAGKTGTLDQAANNLTLTGAITGPGTLNKTGSGNLTLTADSTANAGALRIQQGALTLDSTARLGGAITLEAGTKLDGTGVSTGSLTANAGSIIQVGSDNATSSQNLTLNDLTMNGATLRLDLYTHAAAPTLGANDTLTLTGAYTPGAGSNTLDIQTLKVGQYNLGNFGAFADQTHTILIGGQSQIGARQTATLVNDAGNAILTTTSDDNCNATWTGGNIWNINTQSWTLDTSTALTFAGGDAVHFTGAGAGPIAIEGSVNVASMTVSGNSDYTFTGGAIKADAANIWGDLITGDGKLHKTGAGTLAFENEYNIFRGGIELAGGALSFTNAAQLNTEGAGIAFTAAATLRATAPGLTLSENITIADGITATLDTAASTLAYTGALASDDENSILAKTGAGTLLLTADNSAYHGKVTVDAGALLLTGDTAALGGDVTVASGAIFGGNGSVSGYVTAQQNATIQVGNSPGVLTINETLTLGNQSTITGAGVLTANAITLGAAAGDKVLASIDAGNQLTITSEISGTATLLKQGAGTLTINALATGLAYAATQIDAGTLQLRDVANTNHQITLNGGWLDISESMSSLRFTSGENAAQGGIVGTGAANSTITLGAGIIPFQVSGALTVNINSGSGNVTELTAQNTYTGNTSILSGTLVISSIDNIGGAESRGNIFLHNNTAFRISGAEGNVVQGDRDLLVQNADSMGTVVVDAGVEAIWRGIGSDVDGVIFTKRGDGILTTLGENNNTLMTYNLEAGTLGLMATGALGSVEDVAFQNTVNILGANTAIRIGNRVDTINPINLNANTLKFEVLEGTGTWSGAIRGSGGITKVGSGELVLNNLGQPSTYSGLTTVNAGILRIANPAALSQNATTYNIGPLGTLHMDGAMVRLNTVRNQGTLHVGYASSQGEGLTPTGSTAPGYVGNDGYLVTGSHGALYKSAKLTLDNYHGDTGSRVILNWGLVSDTDTHIKTDLLSFTPGATITGTSTIVFAYQGQATSKMNRRGAERFIFESLNHNVVDDNVNAGLHFTGTFVVNNFVYAFRPDEYNDLVVEKIGVVPQLVAAKAIDAVALFSNKTALDSLNRRFTSLRSETGMPAKGFDVWLGGGYRQDTLRETLYSGYGVKTTGVQAGIDFIDRDKKAGDVFFLGLAFDYLSSSMDSDARSKVDWRNLYSGDEYEMISAYAGPTRTGNTAYGVGLYGGMKSGPWYIEAMMRASKDKYEVRLPLQPGYALDMDGSSFGGSLETGYVFSGSPNGWIFEPQAQIIMQRSTVDPTSDNTGQLTGNEDDNAIYNIDTIQSMSARAGAKIMKPIEWKSGCLFTPYLRASLLHEFAARNKITVNNDPKNNPPVETDLGGSVGMLDIGFTWRLNKRLDTSLDIGYYYGNKYYGYNINLGARYNW